MGLTLAYRVPGAKRSVSFTVPDIYRNYLTEDDANHVANTIRVSGKRATPQRVRSAVLSLGSRRAAIALHGMKP